MTIKVGSGQKCGLATGGLRARTYIQSPVPAPPTGLAVTSTTGSTVVLNWNDSSDIRVGDDYQIYMDDVWVASASASAYTATGLDGGQTYQFRVSVGQTGSYSDWTATVAGTTTGTIGTAAINRPANPFLIAYQDTNIPTAPQKAAWSQPGALIMCGRNNFGAQWLKDCAAAGATVLMYFHAALTNTIGRYADMFYNPSEFGSAATLWPANSAGPGPWVVDEWGSLPNFKVTQTSYFTKLAAVLNRALDENPHIAGFFMDGLGSRHWPGAGGFSWDAWPTVDQEAYRAGEIMIAQTVRNIADARDCMIIANGVWQGGGIDVGGGYPDRSKHGCSLVDGALMENRPPTGPGTFAYEYAMRPDGQWGLAIPRIASMPTPRGYILSSNDTATDRNSWVSFGAVSHAYSGDFSAITAPWGSFTNFNMPNRA